MENFISHIASYPLVHQILRAVLILCIAALLRKIMRPFIEQLVRQVVPASSYASHTAERKREDTLIQIFHGVLGILIWIIAALMALSELHIEIGPLLAGLGIVGVAVGFGGQYLVRDIITGVFLIIENQYRVGDIVSINGFGGTVEKVSLRTTHIRGVDGTLHVIPNGEIKATSNKTKDFSRIWMKLHIAYPTPIDSLEKVINEVGQRMMQDEDWARKLHSAPVFKRVDDFANDAYVVVVTADTEPQEQWAVAGELRARLKVAFDEAKIKMFYPILSQ